MTLMTQAPPPVDAAPSLPATVVRKSRYNVAGASTLWTGPQANPRRIRLTTPGNPVHR